MDKNQLLSAFSQFLDTMGGQLNDDHYGEEEDMGSGRLPIWSEMDAAVPDVSMGPIHSRESLFKKLQETAPMQQNAYGMPVDDQAAEMMIATGMM